LPSISTSGFPGKRVELYRAGMMATAVSGFMNTALHLSTMIRDTAGPLKFEEIRMTVW
jgi:hypothetical protein